MDSFAGLTAHATPADTPMLVVIVVKFRSRVNSRCASEGPLARLAINCPAMKLRTLLKAATGLCLLIGLVAVAVWLWLRGSGRPIRQGEQVLAGLSAKVEVTWDRWGVPHIAAETEEDASAALGWVHANDRFAQMELGRRAGRGRLAEILGEAGYEADVYFRTLRYGAIAERMLQMASPRSRRLLDAYAEGVNGWLAARDGDLPPAMRLLAIQPEPWQPVDSLSFALLMARDLSFWNDRPEEERYRWLRHFGTEGTRDLLDLPDLHIPEEILRLATAVDRSGAGAPGEGSTGDEVGDRPSPGSNNWALSGLRTASGKPLLANDPHLGLFLPSVWYQAMVRSPQYEASGMTLPGTPGVIIGRGPNIAWAFTNTMLDDHDLFFEQLDETGQRYRRGETWRPLQGQEEVIQVRGGAARTITVYSTDIGPLLPADPLRGLPPRSLAWTAQFGGDPVAALFALAGTETATEALGVIEPYTCPAQNLVATFANGELLYTVLGRIPRRRGEGHGIEEALATPRQGLGRLPAPAWDPSYGWDGLRPRESNPTVILPPDGTSGDMLVTANHDIRPQDYGWPLAADFFTPHRAERITQRLRQTTAWQRQGMADLQLDVTSLYARDLVAALATDAEGLSGDAAKAYEALRRWDGAMELNGPAALYALTERNLLRGLLMDEVEVSGVKPFADKDRLLRLLRGHMAERWFDDLTTDAIELRTDVVALALRDAWREGSERWGDDVETWSFGWLHRLTLRHRLDAIPVLGRWYRRGPYEVAGSATTIAAFGAQWNGERQDIIYGPSMRWVVDWETPQFAFAKLPGGQSGHPADTHYDDQIEPFLAGELHRAPWSEEAVRDAAVSTLVLAPLPE